MTFSRFQPYARVAFLGFSTALLAAVLSGCIPARAARDLRGEYASQAYRQSLAAAEATRSLATELLHRDSPETARQRLEAAYLTALEAARLGDDGEALADPQAVQERTIRVVLWYEGERRGLEDWHAAELQKIQALGTVIESAGEAALRTSRMADAELSVGEDALRSIAGHRIPEPTAAPETPAEPTH